MKKATIIGGLDAPMEDLNDLYLFALAVNEGSFTAAGRAANLTTSRVSRRIADLEERLGVRLLHRTTRKLTLTPVGRVYLQHCQAIVSEAQAAAEAVAQIQAAPRGRVRVTCPALTAQSVLGTLITEFMQTYPEVRISLTATDRIVDLIDEGMDVAIRFRAAPMEDSSLIARPLGENHTYLVASPSLLARLGRPAAPEDLAALPSLGQSRRDGNHAWHLTNQGGKTHVIPFQPMFEATDWIALKQAAVAGLGVLAMPHDLCRDELAAGDLERLLPDWGLPRASLYIVYTSRRGLIPAVRAFIDFAAERLSVLCIDSPPEP